MRIHDIAKKLNVSPSTVSRALDPKHEHLISVDVRKKIQSYVAQVGYVPNRSARELSTGRTHTLGILLPTTFDSYFFNDHMTKVLAGVYRVLAQNPAYKCRLIVLPKVDALKHLEKDVLDSRVDGLLLSACSDHAFSSSHYVPKDLLAGWDRPVVIIGLDLKKSRFSCIYSSNYEAATRVMTYLLRKGHKKIAMVDQVPSVPDSLERVKAYKDTLTQHGFAADSKLIIGGTLIREEEELYHPALLGRPGHNRYAFERGYRTTLSLIETEKPHPSAIFYANDEMAFGGMKALRVLGLRCPQDVAVFGFDGLDAGELLDPQLATVSQPTYELAEMGTQVLLDLIEGRENGPVRKFIPMNLVIRESA